MMLFRFFGLVFFSFVSSGIFAAQIPDGIYGQTSVSSGAGDCAACEIKITRIAPHIIQIGANNGWVGYAYYTQQDDKYRGVSESLSGKGGAYENVVFLIEFTYEGQTITMNSKSNPSTFTATYRKK